MHLPEVPDPGESWYDFFGRTLTARQAAREQVAAALKEKIARLSPELDPDPVKARQRLVLILQAGAIEQAPSREAAIGGLAEALADYVLRDRDRQA